MKDKVSMQEILQHTVSSLYDSKISHYYDELNAIKHFYDSGMISAYERIDHQQEIHTKIQNVYSQMEGFKECAELFGYTIEGSLDEHKIIEKG